MQTIGPIGVFDSGYGGLTVLKQLVKLLPQYDYTYLGDSARSPYGNRSFETIYSYTLQAVEWFLQQNCSLIILACNTASAKALRSIQQTFLPKAAPSKRVLGVIRPTTEVIGQYTRSNKIGILATNGTVSSNSYPIEITRFHPQAAIFQQACPMWVPLIENNEHLTPGADFFIDKYLQELFAQEPNIDTLLLACTHYPLLQKQIAKRLPPDIQILSQGKIVAHSLQNYLERHPEIAVRCSQNGTVKFSTTDATANFDQQASLFYGAPVSSQYVHLT